MVKSLAIVVGINYYEHHPGLRYAVQDAKLMADFLCNYAQFAADHVKSYLGDREHKGELDYPTYSNLLRVLERDLHPYNIGLVDRLWFFFAGHGVSRNGRDYLLTSDSLDSDIDLKIALPIEEVIACLRRHEKANIVLILDSCRQLAGTRSISNTIISEQSIKVAREHGITTIFSCDYGQLSYELDNKEHGSFTYALVEGLKQYTLPNQLESYLRQRVPELNHQDKKFVRQTPRIRVEPVSRVFCPLLPECATEADFNELISMAKNTEQHAKLPDELEETKGLWRQVIELSPSKRNVEAEAAIARIDEKIAQLQITQAKLISKTTSANNNSNSRRFNLESLSQQEHLRTTSQQEKNQQQVIQILEQRIQALQVIIDDAKVTSNIANVQEQFLRWRRETTDFLSEAVNKRESLALVMISPRGEFKTAQARLLNEATQIRNYLVTLSQKLA